MRHRLATLAALLVAALGTVVPLGASPAWAAPTLTVSKTTGLADGTSVTVNGSGFTANLKQIAVGQCIENMKGPTDCNLAGGAQFVNADGSGKLPAVTIKLAQKFGTFDCTQRTCVVAAQILPSGNNGGEVEKNKVSVKISFGAAAAPTSSAPASAESAPATALPKTGPGDEPMVVVLAGTALLLIGVGLLAVLPARRRRARAVAGG